MARKLNNQAFSILEILLASIIFIVTIAGVFATLSAIRKPVLDKESALAASVFGKQVLEALRTEVSTANYYTDGSCGTSNGASSQETCTDFSLALGTHNVSCYNLQHQQGISCPFNLTTLTYNVYCADGFDADCSSTSNKDMARKVSLTINWPDAT